MTYEKLEAKLHQVESQRDYWKSEWYTLQYKMKEREKNYLITNAEKTKKILGLEEENSNLKNENEQLKEESKKILSVSRTKDKIIENLAIET